MFIVDPSLNSIFICKWNGLSSLWCCTFLRCLQSAVVSVLSPAIHTLQLPLIFFHHSAILFSPFMRIIFTIHWNFLCFLLLYPVAIIHYFNRFPLLLIYAIERFINKKKWMKMKRIIKSERERELKKRIIGILGSLSFVPVGYRVGPNRQNQTSLGREKKTIDELA